MRTKFALGTNIQSGLTVALISIPLSLSLAVASGVSPVVGIITALWAGAVAALCGGSNYNIVGPTGALSGIIASYALAQGPSQVGSLALLSGCIILLGYLGHVERYLIFVPSSVIHGFILGVGSIIILSQLNFALGLPALPKHKTIIAQIGETWHHLHEISWPAVIICISSLLCLILLRKRFPTIPAAMAISPFAIALGYAVQNTYFSFQLETLGTIFGNIKPALINIPSFHYDHNLVGTSFIIALVAIIETMLSAKIADAVTKTKHHARKEIFGLGCANIVCGLMGGMPATAALARTALNISAGATSNMSALVNSIGILLGSWLFLPFFSYMPMAVIAAILIHVAGNMVERQHFTRLFKHDKANFAIALLVSILTIYSDPIVAILAGSALALLFLVHKLAASYYEVSVHETNNAQNMDKEAAHKKNVLIYTFKGKLVYLNSQAHLARFQTDFTTYTAIILVLNDLYFIDSDGVDALEEIVHLIHNRGQTVLCIRPSLHIENMLHHSTTFQKLNQKGLLYTSVSQALKSLDLLR